MSLYGLDLALWQVYRWKEKADAYRADPAAYAAGLPLTDHERDMIVAGDSAAMFEHGAHPFLVYSFGMRLNGGFSMEYTTEYLASISGLTLRDIET